MSTTGRKQYLSALTDRERTKLGTDSRRALRHAWPNRHTLRGKQIVGANVAMLRDLASV